MEFRSPHYPHHRHHHQSDYRRIGTGQTIGVIDGKAYGAANVFVIRSLNNNVGGYGGYHRRLESPPPTKPRARQEIAVSRAPPPPSSSSWMDHRQLRRRKRIAKYKMYAYEGKVKNSLKNGVRWIKRTCSKIVSGF